MTDTPLYAGNAGKIPQVNSGETALEYVDGNAYFTGDMDGDFTAGTWELSISGNSAIFSFDTGAHPSNSNPTTLALDFPAKV